MREGIHPNYQQATVTCNCGNTFNSRWHGCKEETQIPESFFRQSVPIKVRVTVGKLKQT